MWQRNEIQEVLRRMNTSRSPRSTCELRMHCRRGTRRRSGLAVEGLGRFCDESFGVAPLTVFRAFGLGAEDAGVEVRSVYPWRT